MKSEGITEVIDPDPYIIVSIYFSLVLTLHCCCLKREFNNPEENPSTNLNHENPQIFFIMFDFFRVFQSVII